MRVFRYCSGILLFGVLSLPSCEREDPSVESAAEREFTLKQEWDIDNVPANIGLYNTDYVAHFYTLAPKGFLKFHPWPGHYWPNKQGGLSYRWNWNAVGDNDRARFTYPILTSEEVRSQRDLSYLSPIEKYEVYNGDYNFPMTRQERDDTEVMTRRDIPHWYGKCDGWAPAAYTYKSPGSFSTTSKDGLKMSFGAADIQGLLTLFLQQSQSYSYFVSRRCELDERELLGRLNSGAITREQYYSILESADCQGVNPGSLHILLANLITLRNTPFVADVDRFVAVWNQPVYGYQSIAVETRTSNFKEPYAPGTKKTILVETQMFYTQEIDQTWDRVAMPNPAAQAFRNYRYWLELDRNDNIIGGTWESEDRPDFLWRQAVPEFAGAWKPLETLYKLSIADLRPGHDSDPTAPDRPGRPTEPDAPRARYYEDPISWNIDIGTIFYYIRQVGITVSPEVKRVVLEVVLLGGKVLRHFELTPSATNPNYFQVFNHSLAKIQLVGGSLRLRGFDASGRELFRTSSTSSNWRAE